MLLLQYADLCLFNFFNNSYYNLFINNKTKKIFCFLESLCPNHANIKMQTTYDTTHFMLPRFGLLKDYPKLEIGLMILNRNPENYSAEVEQGGDLYRIMGEAEKARLVDKISGSLSRVSKKEIILKSIGYFSNADSDFANRLKKSILKYCLKPKDGAIPS
ncbi:MAG: catalase [Planctomycetia bacterium]|nr:catalase [Planctomycetia bacterium]